MTRPIFAMLVCLGVVFSATLAAAQEAAPDADAAPLVIDDPAVQALLDTNPTTPADLLNVITLLLDLEQPKVARSLMPKLLAASNDEAELNTLGRRVGTLALQRLLQVPELQPQGKQFVDKVTAAMTAASHDPERIASWIERLQDPSYDTRAQAINELRLGGEAATQAIIEALHAAPAGNARTMLETALAGMGDAALGPIGAMLDSGHADAAASAVRALVLVDDPAANFDLDAAAFLSNVPTESRALASAELARRHGRPTTSPAAAGRLYVKAESKYKQPRTEGEETVWRWDAAANRPTATRLSARIADLMTAARYAKYATELAAGDRAGKLLQWSAELEVLVADNADVADGAASADRSARLVEWRKQQNLTRTDVEVLFERASTHNRVAACTAALELLVDLASPEQLLVGLGGRPTTLVRAAVHPNSTIRYAAVAAVLRSSPQTPFVGSSGVADSLARFATAEGFDRALVVDPRRGRANNIAGMLTEVGLRGEASDSLHEALVTAATQADVQLVLIDERWIEPSGGSFLARLRADYRTARLPALILCEPESVERMRTRVYADPYVLVMIRPATPEHLKSQFAMYPLPGRNEYVPGPIRTERALTALAAMAFLLESKNGVFNSQSYEAQLLRAAASPTLGKAAIGVLARLGSAAAQRTLVDLASAQVQPLEVRQAAASAFCESVIRFHTLLTTEEILRQYARYNASESLDRPTQELLAAILDAIEARAAKVTSSPSARPATPGVAAP